MAQLCYSNSRKYRYKSDDDFYESNLLEETKKLEIVKRYVAKQLNSVLKLEDCLSNRNKFTPSATQEDVSQFRVGGLASLSDFKNICNSDGIKEALKGCRLNKNEIEFLLLHDSVKIKEHPDVHLQKLKSINEKLLIRQQFLIEEDVSRDQSETESYPPVPKNHPINFLPQLEATLFPQIEEKNDHERNHDSPRHKKRRKRDGKITSILIQTAPIKNSISGSDIDIHISNKKTTYWDVKEVSSKSLPNNSSIVNFNVDEKKNCSPIRMSSEKTKSSGEKLLVTIKKQPVTAPNFSKPFVWTIDNSKLTPISVIEQNKMDINIIKLDAKFKNYCCGVPSTTLYVKNLPRVVSPEKIVSIFGNFEKENGSKIEYRILVGKMKGQAFVKFRDLRTSTLALTICNGYIIDGKPIVIEYGKR